MARTASTHSKPSGKRNRIGEQGAQRGFSPVDLLNLWEPTGGWEEYSGLVYGEEDGRLGRVARLIDIDPLSSASNLIPMALLLSNRSAGAKSDVRFVPNLHRSRLIIVLLLGRSLLDLRCKY